MTPDREAATQWHATLRAAVARHARREEKMRAKIAMKAQVSLRAPMGTGFVDFGLAGTPPRGGGAGSKSRTRHRIHSAASELWHDSEHDGSSGSGGGASGTARLCGIAEDASSSADAASPKQHKQRMAEAASNLWHNSSSSSSSVIGGRHRASAAGGQHSMDGFPLSPSQKADDMPSSLGDETTVHAAATTSTKGAGGGAGTASSSDTFTDIELPVNLMVGSWNLGSEVFICFFHWIA